jgi:hypothetical protein
LGDSIVKQKKHGKTVCQPDIGLSGLTAGKIMVKDGGIFRDQKKRHVGSSSGGNDDFRKAQYIVVHGKGKSAFLLGAPSKIIINNPNMRKHGYKLVNESMSTCGYSGVPYGHLALENQSKPCV